MLVDSDQVEGDAIVESRCSRLFSVLASF